MTTESFSLRELPLMLGGLALSARSGADLADGNLGFKDFAEKGKLSGIPQTMASIAAVNIDTLGHSEAFREEALKCTIFASTVPFITQGISNIWSGKTLKGVCQFALGAAGSVLTAAVPSKTVAIVSQAAAVASASAYIASSGVKDLYAKGEKSWGTYAKGVAKIATGVAGIALSGISIYSELTRTEEDPFIDAQYQIIDPQYKSREITLATVYNNNGNAERDKISDVVVANHQKYAEKWGLGHDVVTATLVAKQCLDPASFLPADCSPYMNKIQYLRQQCSRPVQDGVERWVIYGDDDLVYNPNINPWNAIDRLREGKNTSLILAREPADWVVPYPLPGHTKHDPRVAVNSGFILARMDQDACSLIERTWEHRNTAMDPTHSNFADCPTVAFCKNHGITSLGDQTAMALALQENLSLIDHTVSVLLPRDSASRTRGDIALNTMARDGCQMGLNGKILEPPYDIGVIDRTHNQHAIPEEDWTMQPAGFRVMGKYPLPRDQNGMCIDDPSIPLENIRLKKIRELFGKMPKDQRFTIGMTYLPDGNEAEAQYNHLTRENHAEYARRNRASFQLVEEHLLKAACTHPASKEKLDCVPYWNKVKMVEQWLYTPQKQGTEEWFVYGDDDGIYGNMGLELSKVVKDLQDGTDASILIAEDLGRVYSKVNTGFMMFRKDEASRKFVDAWLIERDAEAVYSQGDPDCPTLGLCKNQKGSLHEQEAFVNLLNRNPDLENTVIKIARIRDPKRGYGVNSLVRHGCFSRSQQTVNWNTGNFEYADDQIDRTGKGEKGDLFMQAAGVPRMGRFCSDSRLQTPYPIRKKYVEEMLKSKVKP